MHEDSSSLELIKPELNQIGRSSVAYKKQKDHITFSITAEDPTALRAAINAILKLYIVYEKMKKISPK